MKYLFVKIFVRATFLSESWEDHLPFKLEHSGNIASFPFEGWGGRGQLKKSVQNYSHFSCRVIKIRENESLILKAQIKFVRQKK